MPGVSDHQKVLEEWGMGQFTAEAELYALHGRRRHNYEKPSGQLQLELAKKTEEAASKGNGAEHRSISKKERIKLERL